jgi:hypothetical protein
MVLLFCASVNWFRALFTSWGGMVLPFLLTKLPLASTLDGDDGKKTTTDPLFS